MKIWIGKLLAVATATICLTSCASYNSSGSAAGSETGAAQSESPGAQNRGEFYRTETLTPGVGSALFPDPAWR